MGLEHKLRKYQMGNFFSFGLMVLPSLQEQQEPPPQPVHPSPPGATESCAWTVISPQGLRGPLQGPAADLYQPLKQ